MMQIAMTKTAETPTLNTPVCDPLRPDNLFPFEVLNFVIGQVIGDDVGGLGTRIVDVELAAVQHHQPAQLICTGLCKIITCLSYNFSQSNQFLSILLYVIFFRMAISSLSSTLFLFFNCKQTFITNEMLSTYPCIR